VRLAPPLPRSVRPGGGFDFPWPLAEVSRRNEGQIPRPSRPAHPVAKDATRVGQPRLGNRWKVGPAPTIERGVALEEESLSSNPKRADLLLFLATGQVLQGEALEAMRREQDALQTYEKGSKLLESAALSGQNNVALVACFAAARVKAAGVLVKLGRFDEARDTYEKIVTVVQPLSVENVGSLEARYLITEIYTGLGDLASHREIRDAGSSKEACEFYQKAVAVWQQLPSDTVLPPSRFGVVSRARVVARLNRCGRALGSRGAALRLVPQPEQSRLQ